MLRNIGYSLVTVFCLWAVCYVASSGALRGYEAVLLLLGKQPYERVLGDDFTILKKYPTDLERGKRGELWVVRTSQGQERAWLGSDMSAPFYVVPTSLWDSRVRHLSGRDLEGFLVVHSPLQFALGQTAVAAVLLALFGVVGLGGLLTLGEAARDWVAVKRDERQRRDRETRRT